MTIAGKTKFETVLWMLICLYAIARILTVLPSGTPMLLVIGLHVFCPAMFALIHGARLYGLRGICVFIGIYLIVGNIFENLGVLTGFPFGRYHFTDVMGPKLFLVPLLLGLAYVGMAYLSWTLARVIIGPMESSLQGSRVFVLPLVASFIVVAWDVSQEPIWATVVKAWIWVGGGPYFGVPLSNFLGWFLVVYILYQLFALYEKGRSEKSVSMRSVDWRLPILFYALSAVGNLLLLVPQGGPSVVSDATGKTWAVQDITATCALVSVFTMGVYAFLAWTRLAQQKTQIASVQNVQHGFKENAG
jgi:putative membrane protein